MDIVNMSIKLNDKIEEKFKTLNWIYITIWQDYGRLSILFTDTGETEDMFFNKMKSIKKFIKSFGYTAELIKFYADCNCPYPEATIKINLEGGEL